MARGHRSAAPSPAAASRDGRRHYGQSTGPARVNQGDTAHIVVTIKNVGGQDVTTNFDVVLTDGVQRSNPGHADDRRARRGCERDAYVRLENRRRRCHRGTRCSRRVRLADSDPANNTVASV